MLEGYHFQNAYITRNIEAAIANFKKYGEVRAEIFFESTIEVKTPTGPRTMHNKLVFLWVGDLQYELIQPIDGLEEVYGTAVPKDDDSLAFHHICMRVDDWDDFRSRVDQQPFPIAFEGEAGPLKFLYLDARSYFGHYLEYTYMPEEMWKATGGL